MQRLNAAASKVAYDFKSCFVFRGVSRNPLDKSQKGNKLPDSNCHYTKTSKFFQSDTTVQYYRCEVCCEKCDK